MASSRRIAHAPGQQAEQGCCAMIAVWAPSAAVSKPPHPNLLCLTPLHMSAKLCVKTACTPSHIFSQETTRPVMECAAAAAAAAAAGAYNESTRQFRWWMPVLLLCVGMLAFVCPNCEHVMPWPCEPACLFFLVKTASSSRSCARALEQHLPLA